MIEGGLKKSPGGRGKEGRGKNPNAAIREMTNPNHRAFGTEKL
jgi:hypothetical protein